MRFADDTLARAQDGQTPIREVIDDYLEFISWDHEGFAAVAAAAPVCGRGDRRDRPHFASGAPVIEHSRTPVEEVVTLWRAGDTISGIADEFGLPADEVENVLRAVT